MQDSTKTYYIACVLCTTLVLKWELQIELITVTSGRVLSVQTPFSKYSMNSNNSKNILWIPFSNFFHTSASYIHT